MLLLFVLARLHGTDNKFCHNDVKNRWNFISRECWERGIIVASYSGDGDSRILKTMKIIAGLGSLSTIEERPWFKVGSWIDWSKILFHKISK